MRKMLLGLCVLAFETGTAGLIPFALTIPNRTPLRGQETRSRYELIAEQGDSLRAIAGDLLDMAKAYNNSTDALDYEIALSLSVESTRANEMCQAATDLVFVFDQISPSTQANRVRTYIQGRIRAYAKQLASASQSVSNGIAHAKHPGLALVADKLKQRLVVASRVVNDVVLR